MANLILNGSTSGSVTLSSPAVSGTTTLTLPTTSGTVIVNSGAQTIEFADGSAAAPSITNSGDTNTGIFFPAADTIAFSEGGAEAMRINSSGNVGIGTSSPASKLNVRAANITDTTDTGQITILTTTAQAANVGGKLALGGLYNESNYLTFGSIAARKENSTSGNWSGYLQFSTRLFGGNLEERMRIDSSGGLILAGSTAQKATGTTWSNPSDQRLKHNIRDYTKGTTELMQVRVREWEYNGKGGTTEGMKGLGVVADEVMTVLPNTVETYDAKLNADDEENTEIKKFDATEITWLLVKAVQEQQTIIETLKSDITELKAKVNV
jgi:hypothetical protein